FEHVNTMFIRDANTRMRKLKVRTYTVIPTTPQSGIIEWVSNTISFGGYLCDGRNSKGAHSRYYPNDWTYSECRRKLAECSGDLLTTFNEICSHFHPSFRFFFLENFRDCSAWMNARLNYTRSVASSSMIGYVL